MKKSSLSANVAIVVLGLAALLALAHAGQPLKIDFSDETVGTEPKSFASVVGVWRIENDGNNRVLVVDGRQWKQGQTAAGIADKARSLYGDRYAEFLDRVQAYAYFPYAVVKDVTDFRDGEISVRFSQGQHRRAEGRSLSRRQTLPRARAPRAGIRTHRPVVQGRQPHVLRRFHGDAG
jgi:hypothetical protein